MRRGRLVRTLEGHGQTVWCVAVYDDTVVSASDDTTAKIRSISCGECLHTLTCHAGAIYALAVSVQRGMVGTGSKDTTVRVWKIEDRYVVIVVIVVVVVVVFRIIATHHPSNTRKVELIRRSSSLAQLQGHTSPVEQLRFRGPTTLVSTSSDGNLCLWRVDDFACLRTIRAHESSVTAMAPHGANIITGERAMGASGFGIPIRARW